MVAVAATSFVCPGIIATDPPSPGLQRRGKQRSSQIQPFDRDQCGGENEPKRNLRILASSDWWLATASLILLSLLGVLR
jgi:hypothetical protein